MLYILAGRNFQSIDFIEGETPDEVCTLTLKNLKKMKFLIFSKKYQKFNRKLQKNTNFQKKFRGRSACRASRRNSVRIFHVDAEKIDKI